MTETRLPSRATSAVFTHRSRPRSLWGQGVALIFQPGNFFHTLPPVQESRQWFWAVLVILALTAAGAVVQSAPSEPPAEVPGMGGAMPGDLGGVPGLDSGGMAETFPEGLPTTSPVGAQETDVSATWVTALLAVSGIVLSWLVQAVILGMVSLLNNRMPRLGYNLQIAVWASLPLGLMAGLQLLYGAAGGTVGEPGLSGLLADVPGFDGLPPLVRGLALTLASLTTIFWLWNLALLYIGARRGLSGKPWAAALSVAAWVLLLVLFSFAAGGMPGDETAIPEDLSYQLAPDLGMPVEEGGGMPDEMSGVETPADRESPDEGGSAAPAGVNAVPAPRN